MQAVEAGTSSSHAAQAALQPTRTQHHDVDHISVVGPELAHELSRGTAMVLTPRRSGEVQFLIADTDSRIDTLNASLAHKASTFHRKRQPNEEAAVRFLQRMARFEALPKAQQKATLELARTDLLEALGFDPAQVKASADRAGRWSNLHVIPTDVIAALPLLLTEPMRLSGKVRPEVVALLNLGLQVAIQTVSPYLSSRLIQPMLEIQRQIREVVSSRYGGTGNVDEDIHAISRETREVRRLVGRAGDGAHMVTADTIEDAALRLDGALKNYRDSHGIHMQRYKLYVPENIVRMTRATALVAGVWMTFALQKANPESVAAKFPWIMVIQLVTTLAAWAAHWTWAGPKRDQLLRDELSKVDIAKFGPDIARGMMQRQGVSADAITATDHEARTALRALVKDRDDAKLGMAETLFKADERQLGDQLSELLQLPIADVARWHELSHADPSGLSAADRAFLTTMNDTVHARTAALNEPARQACDATLHALRTASADIARLNDPGQWQAIAPARKALLNAIMTDPPTTGTFSQYVQYLFRGTAASSDMVRVAHLMAKDTQSDWRRSSPDTQYKYGKAFQMVFGGSVTALTVAGGINVAKAFGNDVPTNVRIPLSVVPIVFYYLAELTSGVLVNQVIEQRAQLLSKYPHGTEPGWAAKRAIDLRTGLQNMFCVPREGWRQVSGTYAHWQAEKALSQARDRARQLREQGESV